MPQIIGKIPEFTMDEGTPEVKPDASVFEETTVAPVETETPLAPPTGNEPASEVVEEPKVVPAAPTGDEVQNQLDGLQRERTKLLREISELKGERRELKKEELFKAQETITELEDVNPEDAALIEKVLRSRGYITKEESQRMFYESVKQEELNKFLDKYPEYKPENDPGDVNWKTFRGELETYFKLPTNPHLISDVLERVHRAVRPLQGTARPSVSVAKRQLEVASVGSGGVRPSSSLKTLSAHYKQVYRDGGWTEEEIKNLEQGL